MTANDKNQGKKIRFNIIDLLIVLAVIAVIGTVIVRYDVADKIGKAAVEDSARITLLVQSIREEACNSVNDGDEVTWVQEATRMGNIVRKEVSPAVLYSSREDGVIIKNESALTYDLRCTVDTKGTVSDDGYLLNGVSYIAPGKSITIRNHDITLSAIVLSVDQIN
mgnify:CR=1 FL=1